MACEYPIRHGRVIEECGARSVGMHRWYTTIGKNEEHAYYCADHAAPLRTLLEWAVGHGRALGPEGFAAPAAEENPHA